MAATKISLKLLIDTTNKRVLFAEAGKDFVDFLFNILALPVGTVIRLLTAKKMVGCLGNLYQSIGNLDATYMQPNQSKDSVLKPKASICSTQAHLLLPNTASSSAKRKLYKCVNYKYPYSDSETDSSDTDSDSEDDNGQNIRYYSKCRVYVADDPRSHCPNCKKPMTRPATYVAPPKPAPARSSSSTTEDEGGYVKGVVTYMVMDDLAVKPMSTISSIAYLNQFKVKDLGSLQEKVVELGMEGGVKLLSASLISQTVLTDVFYPRK